MLPGDCRDRIGILGWLKPTEKVSWYQLSYPTGRSGLLRGHQFWTAASTGSGSCAKLTSYRTTAVADAVKKGSEQVMLQLTLCSAHHHGARRMLRLAAGNARSVLWLCLTKEDCVALILCMEAARGMLPWAGTTAQA